MRSPSARPSGGSQQVFRELRDGGGDLLAVVQRAGRDAAIRAAAAQRDTTGAGAAASALGTTLA